MKRMNKKTKAEQFFLLTMMFVALLGIFCVTGCGGNSCETFDCGSEKIGTATAFGCSIPGCGGCLTSGRGCNTACWPQSCKCVTVTDVEEAELNGEYPPKITGCDTRYYGDGCLGCAQSEKSCYYGVTVDEDESLNAMGCFYGSQGEKSKEKMIGYYHGCIGCIKTDGEYISTLEWGESMTEVD